MSCRRLKDYKGYVIEKEKANDFDGYYYYLEDNNFNIINVYKNLKDLKNDVDKIWSK